MNSAWGLDTWTCSGEVQTFSVETNIVSCPGVLLALV